MMPKILIVDDQREFQYILELVLTWAGYETVLANNAEEGLTIIYQNCPDLIILDNQMPGMSGSELCQKIKNDPSMRNCRVVLYSTSISQHMNHWKMIGADAALRKPCPTNEILSTVRQLLA